MPSNRCLLREQSFLWDYLRRCHLRGSKNTRTICILIFSNVDWLSNLVKWFIRFSALISGVFLISPIMLTLTSISDAVSPSNSSKTPEGSIMGFGIILLRGLYSSGRILQGEISLASSVVLNKKMLGLSNGLFPGCYWQENL